MKKAKAQLGIFFIIIFVVLFLHAALVVYLDPFFHFHPPLPEYYYKRPDTVERYFDDGVARNFDYDSLILGVSLSAGFSVTEFDRLFGMDAEKIIYSGGTYKEMAEGLDRGLASHPDTKLVLTNLTLQKLIQDKDHRRSDISDYPTYLYNDNIFDDIKYVLNKDVVFNYCYPMIEARLQGREGGVESLDRPGYIDKPQAERQELNQDWTEEITQHQGYVIEQPPLTDEEINMVRDNINSNILDITRKYPGTRFIYFIPPSSIWFYEELYHDGTLRKTLEAEKLAVKLLLDEPNIELYDFNDNTQILEDKKNYYDTVHYGDWIYSFILDNIAKGNGRLTKENVDDVLNKEREYFLNWGY
ncbi:MAG: hypothetical protein K6E91_10900 [Butyrivibrio sp.]|nr:hypothetical protein [Butyrivibrio sp.]